MNPVALCTGEPAEPDRGPAAMPLAAGSSRNCPTVAWLNGTEAPEPGCEQLITILLSCWSPAAPVAGLRPPLMVAVVQPVLRLRSGHP